MTYGLFRHYLHVGRRSGVFQGSLVVSAAGGALSTLYPVGLRSDGAGPGLLGGLGLGLGAAAVLLPFVTLLLLLATAGADEDLPLVNEFRLAGVPTTRRWTAALGATAVTALLAVWPALITGALSGMGDAVRTSASLTGELVGRPTAVAFGFVVALYFLLVGFGLLVLTRSSVHVALAVPLGFAMFLPLLRVLQPWNPLRWLLRLTPFGPVWSTLLPEGRSAIVLVTPVGARLSVAVGWLLLVVAAAKWRLRQDARG